MLQAHLLGGFQIREDGEPIPGLTKSRLQSLLAYLLLHGDTPHSRAHLAYTFWPDSAESQARTNLRRELLHLRRTFPRADHYWHIQSQTLRRNPEAALSLDVADFETALATAEAAPEAQGCIDSLQRAVTLYQGDLLPDLYEGWVLAQREELAQRYLQALEQLIARHRWSRCSLWALATSCRSPNRAAKSSAAGNWPTRAA